MRVYLTGVKKTLRYGLRLSFNFTIDGLAMARMATFLYSDNGNLMKIQDYQALSGVSTILTVLHRRRGRSALGCLLLTFLWRT